ncbi:MAG: hypothetical protein Q8P67_14820 [archaeon]|nr:hypothetical protein [archaeon]
MLQSEIGTGWPTRQKLTIIGHFSLVQPLAAGFRSSETPRCTEDPLSPRPHWPLQKLRCGEAEAKIQRQVRGEGRHVHQLRPRLSFRS